MSPITSVLSVAFAEHIVDLIGHSTFSWGGAAFMPRPARSRRASIPRDAQDYRVLIEFPTAPDQPGWELEVLVTVRNGDLWNPGAHLKLGQGWAEDTDDQSTILARAHDWAMSL